MPRCVFGGVRGGGLSRLAGAVMVAGAAVHASAQPLNRAIEGLIGTHKLADARVAVHIVDLATGATLASSRPDEAMIPASNMKLLTSGAALEVLGDGFAFRTELLLSGDTLVIRGSGDPSLGDPAALDRAEPRLAVADLLARLAGTVREAGVTRVSRVVVDDRVFDRQYVHPTWDAADLVKSYAAEVSGLSFHGNFVSVYPAPAPDGPGHAPVVSLEPAAPWIEIENKARTGDKGGTSAWVLRADSGDLLTLFGEVSARVTIDVSVHDAPAHAGRLFAGALLEAGVAVGDVPALTGGRRASRDQLRAAFPAVRLAGPQDRFDKARTLAVVTAPIDDVMLRCNTDSRNLYAECLLKRVGHEVTREPGSWANGASVVRMKLAERLGPEFAAGTILADGSGLSRDNRVSARTFTRWLAAMAESDHAREYIASLATPGQGTLRRRFRGTTMQNDLYAKSGSIEGVRCLSGYVVDPKTDRRVAFSILVNDLPSGQTQAALKLHEQVIGEIDQWLSAAAGVTARAPEDGGR